MSQIIRQMSKKCAGTAALLHSYSEYLIGRVMIQMYNLEIRVRLAPSLFPFWNRTFYQSNNDPSLCYRFFQCHFVPFFLHQPVECFLSGQSAKDPLLEFADVDNRFHRIGSHGKDGLEQIDA